jgi:alpha-L-rhamnosidase
LPVSVRHLTDDTYIFDMGQNMVGWIQLKVEGKQGQQIQIRHAEMINTDGSLYTENLRLARQENIYFLNGSGIFFHPGCIQSNTGR